MCDEIKRIVNRQKYKVKADASVMNRSELGLETKEGTRLLTNKSNVTESVPSNKINFVYHR